MDIGWEPRRRRRMARCRAFEIDGLLLCGLICHLIRLDGFGLSRLDVGRLPSTTPPFQITKAPKEHSSARYGHNRVIIRIGLHIAAMAMLIVHNA